MQKLLALAVWLVGCSNCHAIIIGPFQDTDAYVTGARNIVIAKCITAPDEKEQRGAVNGFYTANVEVLTVIKGDEKLGRLLIATIYPVKSETTSLLSTSGLGKAFDAHFVATAELSVVPIPATFDLKRLTGKTVKQQVQMIFAAHLFDIEQQLSTATACRST